jgi:hypothetical protein
MRNQPWRRRLAGAGSFGLLPALALCLLFQAINSMAAAGPTDEAKGDPMEHRMGPHGEYHVIFYPEAGPKGWHSITIKVRNMENFPVAVCTEVSECLRVEVDRGGGIFEAWKTSFRKPDYGRLNETCFATLAPGEWKVLFDLPVETVFEDGKKIVKIGSDHFFENLPGMIEYRFVYEASQTAVTSGVDHLGLNLFYGPALPGSSPNYLYTYSNSDILAKVEKGDTDASYYLTPKDPKVLDKLAGLLRTSRSFDVKQSAIRTVIATQLDEAAPILMHFVLHEKNQQLIYEAIHGFLEIHPAAMAQDLADLADSALVDGLGYPDIARQSLIRAIGMIGGEKSLAILKGLEKRLRGKKETSDKLYNSNRYILLTAYARLGEKSAAKDLMDILARMESYDLADALRDLDYTRSPQVAAGLMRFFNDGRQGSRVRPCRTSSAPRTPEEKKVIEDYERNAYVSIKDDALWAATRILPDEKWPFEVIPLRHFTPQEFDAAKKILSKYSV